MSSRIAIIDIGTNTVNLLIVDRHVSTYTILHKERQAVGLGNNALNDSVITKQSFAKAIQCIDN